MRGAEGTFIRPKNRELNDFKIDTENSSVNGFLNVLSLGVDHGRNSLKEGKNEKS
jgi:hypothetical protein